MKLTFSDLIVLLANSPLALWSDWLQAFAMANAAPGNGGVMTPEALELEARIAPQTAAAVARRDGAIAVIPFSGIVTAKPSPYERYGLTASGQSLVAATRTAVNDPEVKAVVWDMSSPGGSTMGMQESHAELLALRGKKPIIAQVNHLAASAAYWMASAADEIAITPSGLTASVGAYMMHTDVSKAMENVGITATFIHAGKDKVLGHDYAPLDDAGLAYYQGLVDHAYAAFTGDVAKGRGVDVDVVRGESYGSGRILTADAARRAGVVDVIRTMGQTLAAYGVNTASGERQRRALALNLLEIENGV